MAAAEGGEAAAAAAAAAVVGWGGVGRGQAAGAARLRRNSAHHPDLHVGRVVLLAFLREVVQRRLGEDEVARLHVLLGELDGEAVHLVRLVVLAHLEPKVVHQVPQHLADQPAAIQVQRRLVVGCCAAQPAFTRAYFV